MDEILFNNALVRILANQALILEALAQLTISNLSTDIKDRGPLAKRLGEAYTQTNDIQNQVIEAMMPK